MEKQIVVCTFANYPMSKGFDRYREEAEKMGLFAAIHTYCEKDLDKSFKEIWGRYLFPYSRGYGYWCWKPYIIKQTLDKLDEGDLLLYTDLGCFFNRGGLERFSEYINIVEKSESGILGFRSQEIPYNDRGEILRYENEWTKGDIFDFFKVRNNRAITNSTQFEATVILIRKCPASVGFVNEWLEIVLDHPALLTDSPSKSCNLEGFVENRHDQSLFSILAKLHNIAHLSTNEIVPCDADYNWSLVADCPIHARRDVYYKSPYHYKHRQKLKWLYNKVWQLKYLFRKNRFK